MADFSRFPFHVIRFLSSDAVDKMTAEEVGQYILLLCRSWVRGKDACLPDDLEYLARHARVGKVSPLVLSKFPVVETSEGPQRRNPVLYQEWIASTSEEKEKVSTESLIYNILYNKKESSNTESSVYKGTSNTTKPYIKEEKQVKYNTDKFKYADKFKYIQTRWLAIFKTQLFNSLKNVSAFNEACQKYGEDVVTSHFDDWAKNNFERIQALERPGFFLSFYTNDLEIILEAEKQNRQAGKTKFKVVDSDPDMFVVKDEELTEF